MMSLLQRRREMMTQRGSSLIPYIRNIGDAYIDTGISQDENTRIIVWARNLTQGSLCGSRVSSSSKIMDLGSYNDSSFGHLRFGCGNGHLFTTEETFLVNYHKYEIDGNVLKVDDNVVLTGSSAANNNLNIYLFSDNNNGSVGNNATSLDICAAQIYKSGTLVRDLTPVQSPNVGFYDSVSGTVFTNAGSTGSFAYGSFDPNAYVPLQYLECTNQQWIDTGLYGSMSLDCATKFRIIGTSINSPSIFGAFRQDTSSTYYLLQAGNRSYKNRYLNFYIDSNTQYQIYNNNNTKLTNLDVIFGKNANKVHLIRNSAIIGTEKTITTSSSFVQTLDTLALGTLYYNQAYNAAGALNGYIYFAIFFGNKNFVPAKVNGVAGFYETINDVFYPSISGTDFVAGPEL